MSSNRSDIDPGKQNDQIEFFADDDDEDNQLLSQAYDNFVMESHQMVSSMDAGLMSKKICEDSVLITLEDLLGQQSLTSPHETLPNLDAVDLFDNTNPSLTEVSSLKVLTLVTANQSSLNTTDNDLSDSSVIATIILMEIFDLACKTTKPLKRWKNANPDTWQKNLAKKRRAEGSSYVIKNKIRPAKVPKQVDCSKCLYKCSVTINEEIRMHICRQYWSMSYVEQKKFLLANIEVKPIRTILLERKRNTKRSYTTCCSFTINDLKVIVCQKFFRATLSICQSVIQNAVNKRNQIGLFEQNEDPRGRHEPKNKTSPEKVEEVHRHIKSFPSMESHYIRKDSKRQYLDCKLSVGKMYTLYVNECKEKNTKPVLDITYRRIFGTDFNLGFFKQKKDQCLICTRYAREDTSTKRKLEAEYQEHINRKVACNEEKAKDKERAEREMEFVSASFDLQVLQIPSGDIGLLYYTRKLTVYNLTVYESALPNQAYCFTWSEINGKKGSCEIGTILYHYLSTCIPNNVRGVSLFSDTCGGQNRNKYVAAILLWAVQKIENLMVIEQKFLESGHSYMEADSMHSSIESAQKYTSIYSMADWINVFKRARSKQVYKKNNKKVFKGPYNVKEFKYDEFKDLKDLSEKILVNTTIDTDGKKVKWLKIKRIRYIKGESKIYYNYDMLETFSVIDVTKKSGNKDDKNCAEPVLEHGYSTRNKKKTAVVDNSFVMVPEDKGSKYFPDDLLQLYRTPLDISLAKKKDLLELCRKGVIPEELHSWFEGLKTNTGKKDRVPDSTISDDEPETSDED